MEQIEDDVISACCASTDSDTSSDRGEPMELPAEYSQLSEAELGQALFYEHTDARRKWRQYTGKPTRKVRGFTRGLKQRKFVQKTIYTRSSGSRPTAGRGSSGGRDGSGRFKPTYRKAYLLEDVTVDDLRSYLGGKGKRINGGSSSAFGLGRKTNPRDKSGNIMKCNYFPSTEHFVKDCTHRRQSSTPSAAFTSSSAPVATARHVAFCRS